MSKIAIRKSSTRKKVMHKTLCAKESYCIYAQKEYYAQKECYAERDHIVSMHIKVNNIASMHIKVNNIAFMYKKDIFLQMALVHPLLYYYTNQIINFFNSTDPTQNTKISTF